VENIIREEKKFANLSVTSFNNCFFLKVGAKLFISWAKKNLWFIGFFLHKFCQIFKYLKKKVGVKIINPWAKKIVIGWIF